MSIAVIHHFCSQERRVKAISEIVRVLRFNGKALIFVWAYEQQKNKFTTSRRKPTEKDSIVTWVVEKYKSETGQREIFERFYHFFSEGELEELISTLGDSVKIEKSGYDCGNWWAIITKL